MDVIFSVVLWKIGSSVVFTIPSVIINEFGMGSYLAADVFVNNTRFGVVMKPWKCGGSVVFTIPSSYVHVFDLKKYVVSKEKIDVMLKKMD